jgi:hypothetical protein
VTRSSGIPSSRIHRHRHRGGKKSNATSDEGRSASERVIVRGAADGLRRAARIGLTTARHPMTFCVQYVIGWRTSLVELMTALEESEECRRASGRCNLPTDNDFGSYEGRLHRAS